MSNSVSKISGALEQASKQVTEKPSLNQPLRAVTAVIDEAVDTILRLRENITNVCSLLVGKTAEETATDVTPTGMNPGK